MSQISWEGQPGYERVPCIACGGPTDMRWNAQGLAVLVPLGVGCAARMLYCYKRWLTGTLRPKDIAWLNKVLGREVPPRPELPTPGLPSAAEPTAP